MNDLQITHGTFTIEKLIQVLEAGGLIHPGTVGRVRTCALQAKGFDLVDDSRRLKEFA